MKAIAIKLLFILSATLILSSCDPTKQLVNLDFSDEVVLIEKVMKDQENAWNAGDLDTFMEGYWKSDKMTFGGKRGFTYGWENTLKNYKKGYPTKEIMGDLTFDIIDIMPVSKTACYMLGKYNLVAKDGPASGYFTLVWRKIDGNWKIVSDHTSG